MKIAILTQPLGHNYGGLLQAYALQTYLRKMGYEVEILDRRVKSTILLKKLRRYLYDLARFIAGRIKKIPSERKNRLRIKHLTDFATTELKMSPRIETEEDLRKYYQRNMFDAFVVGSDQVWRPKYSPSILNFYLDFLDDIDSSARRVAYAASFGVDEWEYDPVSTAKCRKLIKSFDFISVREKSAISLCKRYLQIDAEWVLDPTLLLDHEDYEKLLPTPSSHTSHHDAYIAIYFLDHSDDKWEIAKRVSRLLKKDIYDITCKPEEYQLKNSGRSVSQPELPSVGQWIRSLHAADYVVTDSFHGCVFSIIFNKPFLAIGNARRGLARFESLLELFKLENRLLPSASDLNSELVLTPIEWSMVNEIREKHRTASGKFLLNALNTRILN